MNFEYKALPWNIIFGAGALNRLPEELDKLGYSRALVLATPNQSDIGQEIVEVAGRQGGQACSTSALMHVPVETLEQAMAEVKRLDADCSVSVGGGSTTGLSKALAFHLDLPNIVVPTSYAGSEMTNLWAVTQDNRKITRRDEVVVPTLTIYDPELTLTLPPAFAGASGMNAMAQAVVNAGAEDANPVSAVMALEGIRALSQQSACHNLRTRQHGRAYRGSCTAPAWPPPRWEPARPACIIVCATHSAARSTRPMPRPIPSSCRTASPTTPAPGRILRAGSPRPWESVMPQPDCLNWPESLALPLH